MFFAVKFGDLFFVVRAEAFLAFQKLRIFVEESGYTLTPRKSGDCAPPSTDNHGSSSTPPSLDDQSSSATSSNHHYSFPASQDGHELPLTPPKSALDLTQALEKGSAQITTYLSRPETKATVDEPEWRIEDPRVVDLQIDGSRSSSKTKFRKGLSRRSLA